MGAAGTTGSLKGGAQLRAPQAPGAAAMDVDEAPAGAAAAAADAASGAAEGAERGAGPEYVTLQLHGFHVHKAVRPAASSADAADAAGAPAGSASGAAAGGADVIHCAAAARGAAAPAVWSEACIDGVPGMLEAGDFVGELEFGVLAAAAAPEDLPMFPVWLRGGGGGGGGAAGEGGSGAGGADEDGPLMVGGCAGGLIGGQIRVAWLGRCAALCRTDLETRTPLIQTRNLTVQPPPTPQVQMVQLGAMTLTAREAALLIHAQRAMECGIALPVVSFQGLGQGCCLVTAAGNTGWQWELLHTVLHGVRSAPWSAALR